MTTARSCGACGARYVLAALTPPTTPCPTCGAPLGASVATTDEAQTHHLAFDAGSPYLVPGPEPHPLPTCPNGHGTMNLRSWSRVPDAPLQGEKWVCKECAAVVDGVSAAEILAGLGIERPYRPRVSAVRRPPLRTA